MSSDVSRLLSAMGAQNFPYRDFKGDDVRIFTFPLTEFIAEIVAAKQTYEHEVSGARSEPEAPNPLVQRGRRNRPEDKVDSDRGHVSVQDFLSSLRGPQS
jgi:hypothetical protein